MTLDEKLPRSVCLIGCGTEQGTGFFISKTTILTCYHVVKDHETEQIELHCNQLQIPVHFTAYCPETDLAILNISDTFVAEHYLKLRQSTVVTEALWKAFGCPANAAGQTTGEPLNGSISYVVPVGIENIHDLTCSVAPGGLYTSIFDGFSGSPMVDHNGDVIGVLRFNGTNHLHAVSIKRGAAFLIAQDVALLPDELFGFDDYAPVAFSGFEQDAKMMCQSYAKAVAEESTPMAIATTLEGAMFYPAKKGTLEVLIEGMKRDPENSSLLWTGWLELLSHVALLQGEHKDVNLITITLKAEKISKWLGLSKITVPEQKIQLRFLWTEQEQYFTVLKEYLHGNLKGMKKNTCYIFNAKAANFGGGEIIPGFKKRIIGNISMPQGSGPSVLGEVQFGLLSLRHLNDQVKQCYTLHEASANLEKLFKDAIEQS